MVVLQGAWHRSAGSRWASSNGPRAAARVAQGGGRPTRRRPSGAASATSRSVVRPAAAAAIPRETLTRSPPPGRPAAGRVVGRARRRARDRSRRPGRRRPGRGTRSPGATCRISRELGRRGRPDDEPDRAARAPRRDPPGDAERRAAPRAARRRRRRRPATWSSARARVRGPAQDVGEAVGPFEERRDRLLAEVRADRDRVGAEAVVQRHRLARRRRPDVAALRVDDDRESAGIAARSRSSAASPAEPNASKNARFGLTAAACGRGRLERGAGRSASTPREVGRERRAAAPPGSGSRPRHRTVPVAADRAASRSRYDVAVGRRSRSRPPPAVTGRSRPGADGPARRAGRGRWRRQLRRRDEPARPRRRRRARTPRSGRSSSPTVQLPARRVELDHLQVDDRRRRGGGTRSRRRPATRPARTSGRRS